MQLRIDLFRPRYVIKFPTQLPFIYTFIYKNQRFVRYVAGKYEDAQFGVFVIVPM